MEEQTSGMSRQAAALSFWVIGSGFWNVVPDSSVTPMRILRKCFMLCL